MIDLSKRKEQIYKIKLVDGTILQIKQPSQKTLNDMLELYEAGQQGVEVLDDLYIILTDIFNRNTNGIEFTKDDMVDMLDVKTALEVLQDYMKSTLSNVGK